MDHLEPPSFAGQPAVGQLQGGSPVIAAGLLDGERGCHGAIIACRIFSLATPAKTLYDHGEPNAVGPRGLGGELRFTMGQCWQKIRNPKSEIRNKFEIRNSKLQTCLRSVSGFGFCASDLFRISCFGFRAFSQSWI